MVNERTGMIDLEVRLLKARVAHFQWLFDQMVKYPERDPHNPILRVAPQIEEFQSAVDEVKARLERLTLAELQIQPRTVSGEFQKRFRRAWFARKQLEKLAESCDCRSPGVGRGQLLRNDEDDDKLDSFIRDVQRRNDFKSLARDGLNEDLYQQVPAIAGAARTVFCAMIAAVTAVLSEMLEHPAKYAPESVAVAS